MLEARAVLSAAVLSLAGCGGPAPPAADLVRPAYAVPAPDLGIDNAAWIVPGQVARGAQPDAAALRRLRDRGFRTVVNFRFLHSEREEAEALGLKVVEIPMVASLECDPPTDAQIRRFLDAVGDPANRPVFFHCAQGKDRTGVMAAVYRMEVEGWTPEEALAEMKHFGVHGLYEDLEEFVRGYRPRGFAAGGK